MAREADKNAASRLSPIASNDILDVIARRSHYDPSGLPVKMVGHERFSHDWRARFATVCIERWGMIVAQPDGEDSTGRQKMRMTTPAEIVERACDCADAADLAFRKRGWALTLPSLQEITDAVKDAENGND